MSELLKGIEAWFKEQPKWLQDAARRLIQKGHIDDSDIKELIHLCKAEVGLVNFEIEPISIPIGSLDVKEGKINLRLNTITKVKGINALEPRKPLHFGEYPLSIIYGQNGSGKSGYVRLLKHACGARKAGQLLKNVFSKTSTEQGCTFEITNDTGKKEIEWNPGMGIPHELKAIEIYDSACANIYVNEENEVTYEPIVLTIFTDLTNICDIVGQSLKNEADRLNSNKPKLPDEYSSTEDGVWYNKLDYKTELKDINEHCLWSPELEKNLEQFNQRLAEANPLEKAKELRKRKLNIESLHAKLKKFKDNLSDSKCEYYISLRNDVLRKRKASSEDMNIVFNEAPLVGVGTESWKLLWESARKYSETVAYPGKVFPFIDEDCKCVLCQQPINEKAKRRLRSFEEFVKGDLEKAVIDAKERLTKFIEEMDEIPNIEILKILLDLAVIHDENGRSKIIEFYVFLENRRNTLTTARSLGEISLLPSEDVLKSLSALAISIEVQVKAFEEDSKGENRDELIKRKKELEIKKWLYQQKTSVEEEVKRLKILKKFINAQGLTNTKSLSIKKSLLSDNLVTNEFIKRFNQEVKLLGASRLKVEMLKTKASKGHIYHKIKLKGCVASVHTGDVLSEGEFRIISLAAFLADARGSQHITPLILDDPISSLDQDFEEAAVKRIVELCKDRQVIAFTHRLSMLALFEEKAEKNDIEYEIICLRNEHWGTGEPGDTPIFAKKPAKALNVLLNERLAKARKKLEEEGRAEYELFAKGICSDFRILLERLIENDLLSDVIHRFRRSINTVGKIHKLALIEKGDCILFDGYMTKYSKYEHSQSSETPEFLPEPDEIQEDIEQIKNWLDEFKKRTIS